MLPADELARIAADIETLLPDTCTLLVATETRGSDGSVLVTWGTATASVACRFDALNGNESAAGGGAKAFHGYTVTLPADTTITEQYRIQRDGIRYNVIAVDPGKSWAGCLRARVERV